jgi:hypothetical protein
MASDPINYPINYLGHRHFLIRAKMMSTATQSLPTTKRGIIWLVRSLLLLGTAGFLYAVVAASESGGGINQTQILVGLALVGTLLSAYIGLWYSAMLFIASYKQYSFNKARILALVLAISVPFAGFSLNVYIQHTLSIFSLCKATDGMSQEQRNEQYKKFCKNFNPNDFIYQLLL